MATEPQTSAEQPAPRSAVDFEYSNLSGRPPGPFVSLASRLSSGVAEVQQQIRPYAEAWRASNLHALSADGPLWVVIGDSMSQGIGSTAHDRGWVNQTAAAITEPGEPAPRIVNLSISGARVSDVLERQLPALDELIGLGKVPDLVTVLIGSNDMMRRNDREGLPARFQRMLDQLPPGTVVANLPNPRGIAAVLNGLIDRAVADRGLVLANMKQPRTTTWKGKLAQDHFHPNELGYADMAAVFTEAIKSRHSLDGS
jgi:lysophospholipase L1-like esterase